VTVDTEPTVVAAGSARHNAHRFDATVRLAKSVSRGEVVFFIGSGFSIDSEGNSAVRLVGRLLAGILAMDTVLSEETANDSAVVASESPEDAARRRRDECATLDGLRQVFGLEGAERKANAPREPARCMTESNLRLLAREYYNFNEWAVSILTVLSGRLLGLEKERRDLAAQRMERLGTYLLELVGNPVPLDNIHWGSLDAFASDAARGKALFLDIMGFANPAVMAGEPAAKSIEEVARSYDGRLRPRHEALARLAREGVAASIVTTNYDLLIEGAYRLSGFVPRDVQMPEEVPLAATPGFVRIAGADQFFDSGEGQRMALLLKIHGSVDVYRHARQRRLDQIGDVPVDDRKHHPDAWAHYLPAIVFTYREIQTWRADAWSRDLIRTMLRTNTLALCGYSGADPIMHATFREVYEERAAALPPVDPKEPTRPPRKTPVFFFGLAERREFHSLEILRAASAAVGDRTSKLLDHPNFIEFERSGFPTVDDHFRLVVHEVLRELQSTALRGRLRRLASQLLGYPCPDAEYNSLLARFKALRDEEDDSVAIAGDWSTPVADRQRRFDRVVDWTWHFVPGLLRELALAEFVESRQGPGRVLRTQRLFPWYQAASERPEWAAWAAIVELALRGMVNALPRRPGDADLESAQIEVEQGPHAAISFAPGGGRLQRQALYIRLAGFDRPGRAPPLSGAFHRVSCWELGERDVPWPRKPAGFCPRPKVLWDWALGRVNGKKAAHWLRVKT
jgi:hypothetical protein